MSTKKRDTKRKKEKKTMSCGEYLLSRTSGSVSTRFRFVLPSHPSHTHPPVSLFPFSLERDGEVKARNAIQRKFSLSLRELLKQRRHMLVAPNVGDIGGAAGPGGGNPNPGNLRRQSKTEIADAFVRSLRDRGGLDVDAPGVAASMVEVRARSAGVGSGSLRF